MSPAKRLLPMPKCWTSQRNWEEWNTLNNFVASATRGYKPEHYCTDCLPEFKLARQKEGLCEHVGVHFVRIVEQRYDPRRRRRIDVITDALRGVRPRI